MAPRRTVRRAGLLLAALAALAALAGFAGNLYLGAGWLAFVGIHPAPLAPRPAADDFIPTVPPGFAIHSYARGLHQPRVLVPTATGGLLVSEPRAGRVSLLLPDGDGDGRSDGRRTLLDGLALPHGLALANSYLYIAEQEALGRIAFDAGSGQVRGSYRRFVTDLPAPGGHWTRTIHFGPDGGLYLTIGSSCNVCLEKDERRAALLRVDIDTGTTHLIARGLRNSVDFAWRPRGEGAGEPVLYATDNGRDWLGDDFPADELNRIVPGGFYGWPLRNDLNLPDPDLGAQGEELAAKALPPVHRFAAHNAPLGIAFVPHGARWPAPYSDGALVALHGSWNRSQRDGYKVVHLAWPAVHRDETLSAGDLVERDLVTGFLDAAGKVHGRPAFIAFARSATGAVAYLSDDFGGQVWRVAPKPPH